MRILRVILTFWPFSLVPYSTMVRTPLASALLTMVAGMEGITTALGGGRGRGGGRGDGGRGRVEGAAIVVVVHLGLHFIPPREEDMVELTRRQKRVDDKRSE